MSAINEGSGTPAYAVGQDSAYRPPIPSVGQLEMSMRTFIQGQPAGKGGLRGGRKSATLPSVKKDGGRCGSIDNAIEEIGRVLKLDPSNLKVVSAAGNVTTSSTPLTVEDRRRLQKEASNRQKHSTPGNSHKKSAPDAPAPERKDQTSEKPPAPEPETEADVAPPANIEVYRVFFKDTDFTNGFVRNPVGDLCYIAAGATAVVALSLLHVPGAAAAAVLSVAGVGANELGARTSQFIQRCLHDTASDRQHNTLGTGGPLQLDPAMHIYRPITSMVPLNDFWSRRGFTHYCQVAIPDMFLEFGVGSAAQVVSSMQTESALFGIAMGTFGRDAQLQARFARSDLQERTGKDFMYFATVASLYLAQRHFVHLQQQRMAFGNGVTHLAQFTGSAVNF